MGDNSELVLSSSWLSSKFGHFAMKIISKSWTSPYSSLLSSLNLHTLQHRRKAAKVICNLQVENLTIPIITSLNHLWFLPLLLIISHVIIHLLILFQFSANHSSLLNSTAPYQPSETNPLEYCSIPIPPSSCLQLSWIHSTLRNET